ncbi:tryptophan 7-halogenase [Fulvivirga sediminis]|uniref:Tryptophan 7-halogenase n=1 Tax=Fulvivirga sediminis TaxID=2803949 RepID=A0A937F756_9BACT|nr:tryptophan 7-halogenase [Fulvivirga sediminis]MBL3656272.1 tryptophan 7-halogenase [Fulvivirga sediminis]
MTLQKIAIIGAGPAGCACAIRLAQITNYQITIITTSEKDFYIGECVPPEIKHSLITLNVFNEFLNDQHIPSFGSCSYWGSPNPGYNDSILNPHGHGWHLNRKKFNHLLMSTAANKPNINLIDNCTLRKITDPQTLIYKDSDGLHHTLSFDFIIDASGAKSIVAKSFGEVQHHDTSLICIGLKFTQKKAVLPSHLTQIEAVKNGWWYATSLPHKEALIALFTHSTIVKDLHLNQLHPWQKRLQNTHTEKWLQDHHYSPASKDLIMFPAHSFCLSSIYGKNWLAIGDAAMCYDPITSNGIIKAVTEGIRAAEALKNENSCHQDIKHISKDIKANYDHYRHVRSLYYNIEQRWPNSPFWQVLQKSNSNLATAHAY